MDIMFVGGKLCHKFWVKKGHGWSCIAFALSLLVMEMGHNSNCDNITCAMCQKNNSKITLVDSRLYDLDPWSSAENIGNMGTVQKITIKIIQNACGVRHEVTIGGKFHKLLNFGNPWSFNIKMMGEKRNVIFIYPSIAKGFPWDLW